MEVLEVTICFCWNELSFPERLPTFGQFAAGGGGKGVIDSEIIYLWGLILLAKELCIYRTQQGEGENSRVLVPPALAPKPGNIKKGPHLCNQLVLMCCMQNPTLYLEEACQPDKTF